MNPPLASAMKPTSRENGPMRPASRRTFLLAALGAAALTGCQTPVPEGAEASVVPLPPPVSLPRKRVAVLKFDAGGIANVAGADAGSALAAQLTTALIGSGHFTVVEREELSSVLREQEMGAYGLTTGGSSTQVGRLLGAQLLVRAAVTEFEQRAGGGGFRIGVGGMAPGGLGVARDTTVIGVDVRLIDATTGQVVQSHHVETKFKDTGLSTDVMRGGLMIGGDLYEKTPLGRAMREVMGRVVGFIVAASAPLPWTGRVVEVFADEVFVSGGADTGLKAGDVYLVSTVIRELTDPATREVLEVLEQALGEVEIVSVRPRYSVARMRAPFSTKRGDLVRAARPAATR
jgi:curli biogenesis system outer membrane secretion channel CsgG